jgi:hypothetical protein
MAVCLWELGSTEEAGELMNTVPSLRQKIAGKSIPLEVRSIFPISNYVCKLFRYVVEICRS